MCTSAGWSDVMNGLIANCATDGPCNDYTMATIYLCSYLIISYLVVVNMYIAVILENFNQVGGVVHINQSVVSHLLLFFHHLYVSCVMSMNWPLKDTFTSVLFCHWRVQLINLGFLGIVLFSHFLGLRQLLDFAASLMNPIPFWLMLGSPTRGGWHHRGRL